MKLNRGGGAGFIIGNICPDPVSPAPTALQSPRNPGGERWHPNPKAQAQSRARKIGKSRIRGTSQRSAWVPFTRPRPDDGPSGPEGAQPRGRLIQLNLLSASTRGRNASKPAMRTSWPSTNTARQGTHFFAMDLLRRRRCCTIHRSQGTLYPDEVAADHDPGAARATGHACKMEIFLAISSRPNFL